MEGRMFRYSKDSENHVGFLATNAAREIPSSCLILIAGLGEGMMSMAYTELLSCRLLDIDISLVQPNLCSSFDQFGFNSLQSDCQDLSRLVQYLSDHFKFKKISILGHSTGAQDALYFARHSSLSCKINSIILQSGISDSDLMRTRPCAASMRAEAVELQAHGKEDAILSERYGGYQPITASRLLSLTGRLTDDDMFSVDLTEEELHPIVSSVKVPIALCYSSNDEGVPDKVAQKVFSERLAEVLRESSSRVDVRYFAGDHGLSKPEFYEPFVEFVCSFLSS